MSELRLVTVVGATGAQGGAVVRALVETGKYKIRGLTRNTNSEKAQALKSLSDDIEMVTCDINKSDDVRRAFQDSWAIFALTDFWAQPDQPEVELHQGTIMADVAASLKIPHYIFSTLDDPKKLSGGKYDVPHFSQKAQVRDYIKKNHPNLKTIFVEMAFYMQNWQSFFKPYKNNDGTIVFAIPVDQKAVLQMIDIENTGAVIREILNDPEQHVGKDVCICGDSIRFEEIAQTFTKVTGIPAISKTLTEEEYRSNLQFLSNFLQDDLVNMFKWIEEFGLFGREKDWTTGKRLTKLNTFEDWLRKTGWKGE